MRIAIDIDSTLHHYWDQFAATVQLRFGVVLPYEHQTSWRITQLTPEQAQACVSETHGDELIAAAVPYEGAVEAVNRWYDAGHFIHVTTHRPPGSYAATARWLETIGLSHHELYCSFDKLQRCREIGIDILIDDSPVNLLGAVEAGIAGATIVHPWNAQVVAAHELIAASDWPELERLLAPVLGA